MRIFTRYALMFKRGLYVYFKDFWTNFLTDFKLRFLLLQ